MFTKMIKFSKGVRVSVSISCLAGMLFVTGCSKEEAQSPVPSENKQRTEDAMRASLYLAPTIGPVCKGCQPVDWVELNGPADNGTSNYKYLYGDITKPWEKHLAAFLQGSGTIATAGYLTTSSALQAARAKGLIPGKKYKVTFYIASSLLKGVSSYYGDHAVASLLYSGGSKTINFASLNGEWATVETTFTATADHDILTVQSFPGPVQGNGLCYTNLYIGPDAIKMIP
jgi:hypothetical protein